MGVGATIATVAATVISAGVGLYSAMSAGKSAGAPPPTPTPAPMPVMNQQAVNNATQQQTALAAATSGRMSTVLSQSSGADKLG